MDITNLSPSQLRKAADLKERIDTSTPNSPTFYPVPRLALETQHSAPSTLHFVQLVDVK